MDRLFALLASVSALLAVAADAFAAHALEQRLSPTALQTFETGAKHQMYHALALFAVAWACSRFGGTLPPAAGWFFVAGTVLFSGSLYALALTGRSGLGVITPFGGTAFLVGWVLLAVAAARG